MNESNSTKTGTPRNVKCPRCGWVHVGISLEDAQGRMRQAQAFYVVASKVNNAPTRGPDAYLESYRRCCKCGAPSSDFVPALPGEGPSDCAQQAVFDDIAQLNDFQVPDDFPRPRQLGAVPGAQTKFLVVEYQGKFYSPGCTPPELHERWQHCMHLVPQFVSSSFETKMGKRAHMLEADILDQYLVRLIESEWVSRDEARWVIRATAKQLGWPMPEAAHGD